MFKKGEKVFHSLYGVIPIEDVEVIEISGEPQEFYVMFTKGTKVMVPVRNYKEAGLRKLTKSKEIDKVLSVIQKADESADMDWNERFKLNEEKIRNGKFNELAVVVRDLYWVEKEVGLNKKEKEMYNLVHRFLVEELALAKQESKTNAAKILNKALWNKGK